jgi:outer membrane protein W
LNQSNLRPYIFTGINFGILFSAISKVKYYNEISELTLTNGYNKLDLALDLGIGIEYLINLKYSLSLDVRYSHGLLNLAKEGTLNFRGIQGVTGFIYQL